MCSCTLLYWARTSYIQYKPFRWWPSGKNLRPRGLLPLWSQVRALWLLIWWPLEAYMVVNFRARGINRECTQAGLDTHVKLKIYIYIYKNIVADSSPLTAIILHPLEARLSISFCFTQNSRNISYQFKKRNKTEKISSHFKSRSVSDFSAKFRPERFDFIPHVSFRSWKAIELN